MESAVVGLDDKRGRLPVNGENRYSCLPGDFSSHVSREGWTHGSDHRWIGLVALERDRV